MIMRIDVDSVVRKGHPILFGGIVLFAIIQMSISAWVTAQYISRRNSPNADTQTRVQFILFSSVWTITFSLAYSVLFWFWADTLYASVLSHFIFLMLTWIFWIAAAASITTNLGGTLDCNTQTYFEYCGQLNAILAFSWLIWILITVALLIVLICGLRASRRGDGYSGGLVA